VQHRRGRRKKGEVSLRAGTNNLERHELAPLSPSADRTTQRKEKEVEAGARSSGTGKKSEADRDSLPAGRGRGRRSEAGHRRTQNRHPRA